MILNTNWTSRVHTIYVYIYLFFDNIMLILAIPYFFF